MRPLKLSTFRYGTPPKRGEGLRIGTTRHPPRGVPRERWQAEGYFDVWFPLLAPSAALLQRFKAGRLEYAAFCQAYEREVTGDAERRQAIELLATLAQKTPLSIGCFCEDETRCHRTHLQKLINAAAERSAAATSI